MYNAEQKERFLSETQHSDTLRKSCRMVFQAVRDAEALEDQDIAEFSVEQLTSTLRRFRLTKISSASRKLRFFRKYQQWCGACGIATTNSAMEIDASGICRTDSRMFGSPGDLQRVLNAALRSEQEASTDSILRLYFWCAFAGLPEEALQEILLKDVNVDVDAIRCRQRYYRIERLGHTALFQCALEPKMYSTGYVTEEKSRLRNRVKSDYLFRSLRSRALSPNDLRRFAANRSEDLPSYRAVLTSGAFYRVFSEAQDPDRKEIDFDGEPYQLYQSYSRANPSSAEMERERQLLFQKEYLQWLQTFYGR